jgi:molecular chaperone DnaJ
MRRKRKIVVHVPAGIDDGFQLRLRGEGDMPPNGGVSGDLYALVHVMPHPYFTRDGDDLLYDLIVGFPQVALGAEVSVPSLDGNANVKIRPATQVGEVVRLKGRGMPRLRGGGRGDLLVRVVFWFLRS